MREGFVDLSDVRLWHWDTGGAGEAVVLCHPASQGCQIWQHQRQAFSAAGYRVIGYSRRGVYKSESGNPAAMRSTVEDLAELLDVLDVSKAHLLGAAAGGITATAFAVRNPHRIRSLVLAGTIVAPDEAEWREMFARLGIAGLRGKVSDEFLELGPSYRASDPAGSTRFAALSEEALHGKPAPQPVGVRVTWKALESLPMPVLLITGEADLYAPPPLMRLIAGHIPRNRLETLRECGHAPYWETPADFNGRVLAFLGEGR
ncbi:MAG: alpha/beta fold hydrolase [Hyphomicrobiaceae bacterium]